MSATKTVTQSGTAVGKLTLAYDDAIHQKYRYHDYLPVYDEETHFDPIQPFEFTDRGLAADKAKSALLSSANPELKVSKITPVIGTEIRGLQLSQLNDTQKNELALLIAERGVVIFRGQDFKDIGPEKQTEFARYFGPLHVHPVGAHVKDHLEYHNIYLGPDNEYRARQRRERLTTTGYHSDVSYEHQPPGITILTLLSVPPTGGDTAWASQTAAYARLSQPIKTLLEGLRAEHSGFNQAENARRDGKFVRREPVKSEHPIVRFHPVTGEKALFVNKGFTKRIIGLNHEESDALLQLLFNHIALGQDFQVRVKWEEGTVALWDNRVTAHTAISDFDIHNPQEGLRHGVRLTTQADKPSGVNGLESVWSHRQRTKDYMDALEQEVLRLRAEGDRLNQIATNWKKCAVALINSGHTPVLNLQHISQFGPGIFLWSVSSSSVEITLDDPALFMSDEYQWQAYHQQSMLYPSMDMIPHIKIEDASEEFLLRNFYENVIPTLDVTESTNQGYSRHILPLVFKNQMVRSSILAASASHIQITQGSKSMVDRLNYRSTALAELRQISARPETDSSAPLATILGLMIDDMICGHRECPALLKLAEFWVRKDCPFSTNATEKATRRFLLDQVQLLKAVVCPLYQFNKLLSKDRQASDGKQLLSLNQKDLFEVFSSMESAMAQACHIYSLPTTSSPLDSSGSDSDSSSDDLNRLLDKLQSTVRKIPPYSLGENSLTWVYFVAASRSRRIDHNAFFVARLAELLQRIGHDRVNELLAGLI